MNARSVKEVGRAIPRSLSLSGFVLLGAPFSGNSVHVSTTTSVVRLVLLHVRFRQCQGMWSVAMRLWSSSHRGARGQKTPNPRNSRARTHTHPHRRNHVTHMLVRRPFARCLPPAPGSVAAAAAKHELDRGYRERLRTLSDGLASTQLQLSTLKSEREKQKGEAARARCVRVHVCVCRTVVRRRHVHMRQWNLCWAEVRLSPHPTIEHGTLSRALEAIRLATGIEPRV